ncbi:MAG TPA: YqeG family HAD IIIA-type phosphatase [Candidatus Limnocylindrales bacterium]|nr:YqeG family HAD IIIA-type phosphatase [Candidatus Limnocylindrales bacterium]
MLKFFLPDQYLNSIFEIDVDYLLTLGIKGIITDMDNTLVPWSDRAVYPRLVDWFANLKSKGFSLFIVSNNSKGRGRQLSRDLEIPAIWYAIKPRRRAFRKAIEQMQLSPEQVAVVGDQIFTDVLGGNRLGLYTILVIPISEKEFFWTKFIRRIERLILIRIKRSM